MSPRKKTVKTGVKAKKAPKSKQKIWRRNDKLQRDSKEIFHDVHKHSLRRIHALEKIHEGKKQTHTISDSIAFMSFLIIALLTNFFLSFILLFMIIFLQDILVYIIVAIIGISFGLVYTHLIHSLRALLRSHHIYAKVFVLITGSINVVYIVATSMIVYDFLGFPQNFWFHLGIALVYFVSFLIPYFGKILFSYNLNI
ncbi:MAG: hypothetical protein ACMXYE_00655 [Candidatus Woesearchaeota archaeon]